MRCKHEHLNPKRKESERESRSDLVWWEKVDSNHRS